MPILPGTISGGIKYDTSDRIPKIPVDAWNPLNIVSRLRGVLEQVIRYSLLIGLQII